MAGADIAVLMAVFVRAVDEGGFSAAARALDQTPSAISKQIRRLEDRLGVRLLNRTTRRLSLTDEGRTFYERSARIVAEIEDTEQWVAEQQGSVRGHLKVASTVAFTKYHVLPRLPAFLASHPELTLSMNVTDRTVDLVEEGIDVAISFTEQMTDPSLVARRLAVNRRIICASPEYLRNHDAPETPEDLVHHNCLRLSHLSSFNDWEFERADDTYVAEVGGNFETYSADALYHATLAGLGIARLSTYIVHADLKAGRLVNLLPSYVNEKTSILVVYPHRRHLTPKVRAFIDFLVEHFTPVPPWETAGR